MQTRDGSDTYGKAFPEADGRNGKGAGKKQNRMQEIAAIILILLQIFLKIPFFLANKTYLMQMEIHQYLL